MKDDRLRRQEGDRYADFVAGWPGGRSEEDTDAGGCQTLMRHLAIILRPTYMPLRRARDAFYSTPSNPGATRSRSR